MKLGERANGNWKSQFLQKQQNYIFIYFSQCCGILVVMITM